MDGMSHTFSKQTDRYSVKLKRNTLWILSGSLVLLIGLWLFLVRKSNDITCEGRPLSVWFSQLRESRGREQAETAKNAFRKAGVSAVPFLIDQLHSRESAWKRKYTDFYLGNSQRLPGWVQARLPVPDPYRAAANRGTAALALGLLGDFSKPAITDLGKALNDQSGFVASQAAEVLRGFGPVAREALPMAMTALCATNQMIADTAWRVVSSIGRDTPDLPPQLVKMLENDDVVKIRVLRILAALGSIAAPCQSDIERLVTATNVNVRFAAVAALWDIVPARQIELLPRLEEFIACNDEQLRTLTANKVVQVQPLTKEAVELLVIGIRTSNPEVVHNGNDIFCWGVFSALAKRGREVTNAIPVMVVGLTAANPRVAAKAAEALGNVAGPDKEVLNALKQAQHHEELMVRDAANAAIQKIQSRMD